jgi:hypothetical protein
MTQNMTKNKRIEVGPRGRAHFGFFRVRVEAKIVAFKPHVEAIGAHPIPLRSMFSPPPCVSERPEAPGAAPPFGPDCRANVSKAGAAKDRRRQSRNKSGWRLKNRLRPSEPIEALGFGKTAGLTRRLKA